MHHGLLVARLVVADLVLRGLERLPHPGHDAVSEDAEDALEEAAALAVALDVLVGQPGHDGLGHGQTCHVGSSLECVPLAVRPSHPGWG